MIFRFFDLIFLFILTPFFLPLFIVIYIYILYTIGNPVIFIQNRSGYNGISFKIYKFRTMSNLKIKRNNKKIFNADRQRVLKSTKFLRKTRLDEIPQFYNILKNDISFVGPRPLLPEYNNLYSKRQKKRLTVKPGITGWSQLKGNKLVSWKKRFELDLWYIENISIYLYFKIIFLTFIYFINRLFNKNPHDEIFLHNRFNGKN
jgi:lipopolysaccharide/colanic/teichoic acid biosynthesis glycosyltransferase